MDRSFLMGRRIALGVGGGIAAYKACDLVRELGRAGAIVRVAMTPAAREFITPLTLQALSGHPVLTDYFDTTQESGFGHLDLSRWAEVYVLAPATADLIARIAAGMANEPVATSVLAFRGPVLLAPAMNVAMWENPLTQRNMAALLADSRYRSVGPEVGLMADGEFGAGRLAELGALVDAVASLGKAGDLFGKKVLVTAGPTREHFDPVRYLSNPSSGKMGIAVAQEARARGAQVTVVLGPAAQVDRAGLEIIDVVSAEQMAKETLPRVGEADYFIAAAAVSDYRPKELSTQKLKKKAGPEKLELVRTVDILAEASAKVRSRKRRPMLVGFAAETQDLLENAQKKLDQKKLDAIVANDLTAPGAGFAVDTNSVTVLMKNGKRTAVSGSKREVARRLWDLLVAT